MMNEILTNYENSSWLGFFMDSTQSSCPVNLQEFQEKKNNNLIHASKHENSILFINFGK